MGRKNIDFTKGRLMPLIIAYTVPLVLSGLVQTMFNAADMAVLGAFDKSPDSSAVGAVGVTGAIIGLLVNSVIGLSGGTNVLLAPILGWGTKIPQPWGRENKTKHRSNTVTD